MLFLQIKLRIAGMILVGLLVLLSACSGNQAYLPLEANTSWRYLVHEPNGSRTRMIKVGEDCFVGKSKGKYLTGEGGTSRLAWIGGDLWVGEFTGMRFDPPLVLLKPGSNNASWSYSGMVTSRYLQEKAVANLTQSDSKVEVMGQTKNVLLVTLKMSFSGKQILLETWFQRGIGIVRQEQRINDVRVLALEWIGGS